MTDVGAGFVHQKEWEFPKLGEALQALVRRRHQSNAAKAIASAWGLDTETAKNVVQKGHVSERTLTKAAQAERWALWMALGEELFGETYDAWEEQRLQRIIDEAQRDMEQVRRLRTRAALMAEQSADVDATVRRQGASASRPS